MSGSPAVLLINSMGTGGAERAVAMVADGLRSRGRDVRILCLEKASANEALPTDVPVELLSGMKASSGAAMKLSALPVLAVRLASYVRRERAEVVISHLFRANFVNVLSRTLGRSRHKVIVVNHTRVSRLANDGIQGRINMMLCRRLYPRADLVASVSEGSRGESADLLGIPQGQTATLHDPIDTQAAAAASYSARPACAIVAVGRLIGLKRMCDIVDAFERIAPDYPDVELRIIGDGPERGALEQRALRGTSAARVRFFGRLADPLPSMAGCSVFVSASETEGFGMAIVEALAVGIPVIASDCAFGPREILAPGTDPLRRLDPGEETETGQFGILFPVGSVTGLEKELRRLLDDAGLRAELSRKGPPRAADFSIGSSLDAYEKLLND
jgi:N-acetylgalactosamine-N,N'-diacetylbacillosaminyl-diphospho-undecaprenol 4-alpha-N-acetylgalactosaminyltransferase